MFGTGGVLRLYRTYLKDLNISLYVDNDPKKQGMLLEGKKIQSPKILLEKENAFIIITTSMKFYKDISIQLSDMGFKEFKNYNHILNIIDMFNKDIQIIGNCRTSYLRKEQNAILKKEIATLPGIKKVLNVGAIQEDTDKEGTMYKNYFDKDVEFYTIDKNKKDLSKKHYFMDLNDLSKINNKFDLVLFMSTLEHVKNPFQIAKDIKGIISDGGYLFISVPFFYPIHKDSQERYSDYWRFTNDGIRVLFKDMQEIWIKEVNSVIRSIEDRGMYWDNSSTPSGYLALFRR